MAPGRRTKNTLKRGLKLGLRTAARALPRATQCARVLTYHSVGARSHEMNVTPEAFCAQMTWLAAHYHTITLREAAAGIPGVAITFDDGYLDNLTEAAPILHALDLPATVFMVAGRAGGMLDHDREDATAHLLDWDQVRALEGLGVGLGAHTMTHPRLAGLDEAAQRAEILDSVRALERELGHPIEAFAYPFGTAADYDETSKRLVRESGCELAFTNRYGVIRPGADRWALPRIWIDATDSLASFRAKVDGRLDALAWLDSGLGLWARRSLNRALENA